ncbi:MAG TPA: 5-oxoprolinase subunit PxpA [Candidatus Eremiobacteraceae bacterium]|nr:5-oxoprolinase subunit PxpA [Candidatus Eremiobacteraceae bacterium]
MAARTIDLNCDVGELPGSEGRIADLDLIALVSSVNIACGAHAGDETIMRATISAALASGAVIGAHPSYVDREGFGRRSYAQDAGSAAQALRAQVETLRAIAASLGAHVAHVKPHGALYNDAAADPDLAAALAGAVREVDPSLVLVGLAGGALLQAGHAAGLRVAAEGFCDRAYEQDGSLRSRALPDSVFTDPDFAARQAVTLALRGDIATLCIHGDEPTAVAAARAVRAALTRSGVSIVCPWARKTTV